MLPYTPTRVSHDGELTVPQRRLAALGALLQSADPSAATRAFEFAQVEARRLDFAPTGTPRHDAAYICSVLLEETRIRAEFGRGHIQPVDGWVLTRSEAGVCVYLDRLAQRSPGVA